MPDAVKEAAGGDHDLGVAQRHAVIGHHRRLDAAAEEQPGEAQRDVADDLDVDPGVVGHAESPGGVHRGDVPPRLDLVVGVDGLEQRLEPAIAPRRARGCACAAAASRGDMTSGVGHLGAAFAASAARAECSAHELVLDRARLGRPAARRRSHAPSSRSSHEWVLSASERSSVSSSSPRGSGVLHRGDELDAGVEVARHQVGGADVDVDLVAAAGRRRCASARGSARRSRRPGCSRRPPGRPGAGSRCRAR